MQGAQARITLPVLVPGESCKIEYSHMSKFTHPVWAEEGRGGETPAGKILPQAYLRGGKSWAISENTSWGTAWSLNGCSCLPQKVSQLVQDAE